MAVFLTIGGERTGPQGPKGDTGEAGGDTITAAAPLVRTGDEISIPAATAASAGHATAAQITKLDGIATGAPIADATTARTLAAADAVGVYFTSGSTIAVTAPTLPAGTIIPLVQRGAGQLTITGDGVTLAIDGNGDYLAKSYAPESLVVLWYLTATLVSVTGSLEAAP